MADGGVPVVHDYLDETEHPHPLRVQLVVSANQLVMCAVHIFGSPFELPHGLARLAQVRVTGACLFGERPHIAPLRPRAAPGPIPFFHGAGHSAAFGAVEAKGLLIPNGLRAKHIQKG